MRIYFVQYNKLFLIISILIIFLYTSVISSQTPPQKNILLDEVSVVGGVSYTKSEYFFLKRKILKVIHYVDTLEEAVIQLNNNLNELGKRKKKRKEIKIFQKDLMDRFLIEIKSLTRKEGVILSKLIYRKIGVSVFDLIKIYKGSWNAFFWQSLAKIYDGDLKSKFNPKENKEDFLIEKIILEFE